MTWGLRMRPRPHAQCGAPFWWTQIYAACAGAVDWASATNYGYLAHKPVHSSLLDYFGPVAVVHSGARRAVAAALYNIVSAVPTAQGRDGSPTRSLTRLARVPGQRVATINMARASQTVRDRVGDPSLPFLEPLRGDRRAATPKSQGRDGSPEPVPCCLARVPGDGSCHIRARFIRTIRDRVGDPSLPWGTTSTTPLRHKIGGTSARSLRRDLRTSCLPESGWRKGQRQTG